MGYPRAPSESNRRVLRGTFFNRRPYAHKFERSGKPAGPHLECGDGLLKQIPRRDGDEAPRFTGSPQMHECMRGRPWMRASCRRPPLATRLNRASGGTMQPQNPTVHKLARQSGAVAFVGRELVWPLLWVLLRQIGFECFLWLIYCLRCFLFPLLIPDTYSHSLPWPDSIARKNLKTVEIFELI